MKEVNGLPLRSLERQEYQGASYAVQQINLDQTEGRYRLRSVLEERTSHPILLEYGSILLYGLAITPVFYPERKK